MILFASCSNDLNTVEQILPNTNLGDGSSSSEMSTSKSTNPYETVGVLYGELSKKYYETENFPNTISDIVKRVEVVLHDNTVFNDLKSNYYQPITTQRVQYLTQHRGVFLTEVIDNSSLSNNGKISLIKFVESLKTFYEMGSDCVDFHNSIEKYENIILNSTALNSNDKRIILVTTAIAKHTNYEIKSPEVDHSKHRFINEPEKNKDRDWGVLVGNIMATTEGTDESIAKAISLSLAVNATINN